MTPAMWLATLAHTINTIQTGVHASLHGSPDGTARVEVRNGDPATLGRVTVTGAQFEWVYHTDIAGTDYAHQWPTSDVAGAAAAVVRTYTIPWAKGAAS